MRASAATERTGIPSVSLVASGFVQQAHAIAKALGAENLPVAEYPGVPMIDSNEELRNKVERALVNHVIKGVTASVTDSTKPVEPGPRDVIFKGALDEVQEHFHKNLWTDGLPIIPPTLNRLEEFLRFTDRSPDEVIGVLLPENREATAWNVAVNGVMAGCRPEYMPVLVAIVEAIAEPDFRIEDAGSTPGWEPLVIVNGSIVKELDFNYGSGVMRVGRRANTSIGRFLRLYMRNVPGLRIPPGATDKGSIAQTFNVVLAEDEDAVAELGWDPFSVDRGFKPGENVVTVQSVVSTSPPCYSGGHTPVEHLQTIVEVIGRTMAYKTPSAIHQGRLYPLFVVSPSVAGVLARGGWTKNRIREYLFENIRAPASLIERVAWGQGETDFHLPKEYCQSMDPDRLIPVLFKPEWIGIVVSGDPGRNQSKGYVQNHKQGPPVSKKIAQPVFLGQSIGR
ncbi:MAG: hypothetical protein HYX92_03125 [Chloroflexi bacterium]|nr:hypothetical protein [Chloroflexota bacterium]